MARKFANNALTTLAADIAADATAITVTDGSVFPTLGAEDEHWLTLQSVGNPQRYEIVKVTARVGNALTIERAQQSTTARTFSAGAYAELRWTAEDGEDALAGGASLGGDLTALEALTGTGIARRTADDIWTLVSTAAFGLTLLATATDADARSALSLVVGTNVQAFSAELAAIAALNTTGIARRTGSGTWTVGTVVSIAEGGTGATSQSTARAALGLAIGSNVQAWDADLDALAALTTTGLLRRTAANTYDTVTRAVRVNWQTGVQSAADTNYPSTLREWFATSARRQTVDLTGCTEVRMGWQASATTGVANSKISFQYSTDGGNTWTFLDGTANGSAIGSAGPQAAYDTAAGSLFTSGWSTLAAGARTDVLIRVVTSGGNSSVSPMTFYLWLEAR